MTLSFRYKRVRRPSGVEVKSPSIPITLSGNGGKWDFIALVDSGADISAIPKSVAELLGLDLSGKTEEAAGIGGVVPAIQTNISLEIQKGHEQYSIQLPLKVIISDYEFPVLLGRAGFFDKFIITFDQRNEKILLKKISKNEPGSYLGNG